MYRRRTAGDGLHTAPKMASIGAKGLRAFAQSLPVFVRDTILRTIAQSLVQRTLVIMFGLSVDFVQSYLTSSNISGKLS